MFFLINYRLYVENVEPPSPDQDPLLEPLEGWNYIGDLQPKIEVTVRQIRSGLWSIGSLMICQQLKDGEDMPPAMACRWNDDGATYCLCRRSVPLEIGEPEEGDPSAGLLHHCHDGFAQWILSPNVQITVRGWVEGSATEGATLRWVNKNVPSVPTEELLHDWIDPEWNRAILISKPPPGELYVKAFSRLTTQQRLQVADQVAGHHKALSGMTSDYVETVDGHGIEGQFSLRERKALPTWRPRAEGRISREDHEAYWKRWADRWGVQADRPGIGEPLVLQHPCTPYDFYVAIPSSLDDVPKVTGITKWVNVGYLPKWEVATRLRWESKYFVYTGQPTQPMEDATHWRWMLSNACVRLGFPLEMEYSKALWRPKYRHYPSIPIERLGVFCHLPTEETEETRDAQKK